jgi:hypothetical protein
MVIGRLPARSVRLDRPAARPVQTLALLARNRPISGIYREIEPNPIRSNFMK